MQPRASRNEIVGWQDATLRLRITATPVDGAANAAVVALLARALDVPPSSVRVVRGLRARDKVVSIAGLNASDVRALIAPGSSGVRSQAASVPAHPRSKAGSRPPRQ